MCVNESFFDLGLIDIMGRLAYVINLPFSLHELN